MISCHTLGLNSETPLETLVTIVSPFTRLATTSFFWHSPFLSVIALMNICKTLCLHSNESWWRRHTALNRKAGKKRADTTIYVCPIYDTYSPAMTAMSEQMRAWHRYFPGRKTSNHHEDLDLYPYGGYGHLSDVLPCDYREWPGRLSPRAWRI